MKLILSLCLLLHHSPIFSNDITFPKDFLFGIANAPGHVEDNLDDIWMQFAREGGVRAFSTTQTPEKRLEFWTKPEIEIDLAQELGVGIFRLGVDWGRIHTAPGTFDRAAMKRYQEILQEIRRKNMKVMLTLFHFSLPRWVQDNGGWVNPQTIDHFLAFSELVAQELHPFVDYWITFNEPQVFTTMSYALGVFPPGKSGDWRALVDLPFYQGDSIKALHHMARAHRRLYQWMHQKLKAPAPKIGIAQHMGFHTGKTLLTRLISKFSGQFMNWYFPDLIVGSVDYFGFNYYGAEWLGITGIRIEEDEEYSDAGRAIYPRGLYQLSREIKDRYGSIPQFITENGIGDSTDWLRPSYLIEHLAAIAQLRKENVQIMGYVFWTLTDNMEWSDGYCPKFGLVSVDRNSSQLTRTRRASFSLFQEIIRSGEITHPQREAAWELVRTSAGKERPFCRAEDGVSGLDVPAWRKVVRRDWRFKTSP